MRRFLIFLVRLFLGDEAVKEVQYCDKPIENRHQRRFDKYKESHPCYFWKGISWYKSWDYVGAWWKHCRQYAAKNGYE